MREQFLLRGAGLIRKMRFWQFSKNLLYKSLINPQVSRPCLYLLILMCKFLEYKSLHAFQTKSTIGLWLKVFFQSCFFLQKEAKKLFLETWFANLDGVWGWMHSSLYVKNWTCWYAAHIYTVQTVCQVVDSTAHHSHCTSKSQRPLCRWLQTLLQKIQSSQPAI